MLAETFQKHYKLDLVMHACIYLAEHTIKICLSLIEQLKHQLFWYVNRDKIHRKVFSALHL
jgi:hypothetical protein